MDYLLFPYFVAILSIPLLFIIHELRRSTERAGASSLSLLLTSILGWMIFNMLELVTPTESETLLWAKLTYLFIVATPVLWLFFPMDFFGYHSWNKRPRSLLFAIIPTIIVALAFTNDWHHLIWKSYHFLPIGNYLALTVQHGIIFYIYWVYAQALIFIGIILLLSENFGKSHSHRWRVGWLTVGALIAAVSNIIYISHVFPWLQKDYTPVAMAFSGICFGIALLKFEFFRTAPIGQAILFEALDDGILVIDDHWHVININPAGLDLLCLQKNAVIGKPITQIFKSMPEIIDLIHNTMDEQFEVRACKAPLTYLSIKVSPIKDQAGYLRGRLVLIRDTTREKITQMAEHDERMFAQALGEIAAALNSTRNIDNLLDLIINNVTRVTTCDLANIMVVGENGYAYTVRCLEALKNWERQPVETTPNLHWMTENRAPMVVSVVKDCPEWLNAREAQCVQSYVGAPFISVEKVFGFVNLYSNTAGLYDQKTARRLLAFANQASIAIQNAQAYKKLEELATIDSLTGLFVRRHFFELAGKEFTRTLRYHRTLSIIMVDLDQFKRINDSYGHLVGDQVLRCVAEILIEEKRAMDIIGRYGGEEFVILLPETGMLGAKTLAERLCWRIAHIEVENSQGEVHTTASLGVAELDTSCEQLEDLIDYSDRALYQAKRNGRNRVEVYQTDIAW